MMIKRRYISRLFSGVIITSLTLLLCGCNKKYYKYNGEIYEDSYDFKDDYGYIYLEKTDTKIAKLYEKIYLNMVDFNHKKQDVNPKEAKTLFLEGSFIDGPYDYDELYKGYAYLTAWHPEFYWMNYYMDEENKNYSLGISEPYLKSIERKKFDKKVSDGLDKFDKLVENIDDEFDKIKVLSDYIMDNMYYAFEGGVPSQSEWAHNIIGFFDRGTGVCESYAKVFKLVCDRYNIGNIPVTSEDHIWNLVEYDNKWYTIDLTFADDNNYAFFGVPDSSLDDVDHIYHRDLYELPKNMAVMPLSFTSIDLKENGNIIHSTHSMDGIYNLFTNGNYEVVFNSNDNDGGITNIYISYIDMDYTTLTFKANVKEGEHIILNITKNMTLEKDVTFENMTIHSAKNKKKITTTGTIYLKNSTFSSAMVIDGNVVNVE